MMWRGPAGSLVAFAAGLAPLVAWAQTNFTDGGGRIVGDRTGDRPEPARRHPDAA